MLASLISRLLAVVLVVTLVGCGDSGNQVVDMGDAGVAPQSAADAQKAAEADLPAP